MHYWILLIPFTGALVGWLLSNYMVYRLFKPYTSLNIAGFVIQGYFGKKQSNIARQLGAQTGKQVGHYADNIARQLTAPEQIEKLKPIIESHIDHFLKVKLAEQMPMISMFIGEKTIQQLKDIFMNEIQSLFPELIGGYIKQNLSPENISQLVEQKINALSPKSAEQIIKQHLPFLLKSYTLSGILIGLGAGIVQMILVYCLSLT
ncbi:MAG: hypothetical protein KGO81_14095 [Bacteroidota bacterium]|nr:hypothetical protein [Bacteroidota bacterium]